jgi:hypothetical protein
VGAAAGSCPVVAGADWRTVSTRLRPSFVLRSDSLYSVVLTVAMTLASAAPIKVPATPKNEATTAEDTAARALAATCPALSCERFGCSAELSDRTVVSVRGEDMSSGRSQGMRGRSGSAPTLPFQATGLGRPHRGASMPRGPLAWAKCRRCDSAHDRPLPPRPPPRLRRSTPLPRLPAALSALPRGVGRRPPQWPARRGISEVDVRPHDHRAVDRQAHGSPRDRGAGPLARPGGVARAAGARDPARRPDPSRAEALAAELQTELDAEVCAVGSYREAMDGAHIVCATTHPGDPVVRREWLQPGTHVTSVGWAPPAGRWTTQPSPTRWSASSRAEWRSRPSRPLAVLTLPSRQARRSSSRTTSSSSANSSAVPGRAVPLPTRSRCTSP